MGERRKSREKVVEGKGGREGRGRQTHGGDTVMMGEGGEGQTDTWWRHSDDGKEEGGGGEGETDTWWRHSDDGKEEGGGDRHMVETK